MNSAKPLIALIVLTHLCGCALVGNQTAQHRFREPSSDFRQQTHITPSRLQNPPMAFADSQSQAGTYETTETRNIRLGQYALRNGQAPQGNQQVHKTQNQSEEEFLPDGCQIGWIWPDSRESPGPIPYVPREGDILTASSIVFWQTAAYVGLARSGLPHHVMMVIRKSDGNLGIFEVGAGEDTRVVIRPIKSRLEMGKKLKGGVIAVRQIKRDLTPEESLALTCFAEAQLGKKFTNKLGFFPLVLPNRPVGPSCDNQSRWFCSELVLQALRQAKLICANDRPRKYLPADVFDDDRYDWSALWTDSMDWTIDTTPTMRRPLFDPGR